MDRFELTKETHGSQHRLKLSPQSKIRALKTRNYKKSLFIAESENSESLVNPVQAHFFHEVCRGGRFCYPESFLLHNRNKTLYAIKIFY